MKTIEVLPKVGEIWEHKYGNFMVEITDVDHIREGMFVFYKPCVKGIESESNFIKNYKKIKEGV